MNDATNSETIDTETGEITSTYTGRNVYQRVLDVMADLPGIAKQGKMDAPVKKKDGTWGRMQYDYQKMDDIIKALHPLQVKHGLFIVPDVQKHSKESNLTVITLLVTVINVDDPEDRFTSASLGYGTDSTDKGAAKAYTAALKTFYLRTFALTAEVEPDEDQEFDRTNSISAQDLATLHDILEATAESSSLATAEEIQAELCQKAGVSALCELPADGFKRAEAFIFRKYGAGRKK